MHCVIKILKLTKGVRADVKSTVETVHKRIPVEAVA